MRGYVYAIRSHQTEQVYIGSTTQQLCSRMAGHRRNAKLDRECTSKQILAFDDAYIELIEVVEFTDKAELRAVEGRHIRAMNCVNKCIAGRTAQAYYLDNAEAIIARVTAHYVLNAKAIKQIKREKHDCACGGKFTYANSSNHKLTARHKAFERGAAPIRLEEGILSTN